MYKEKKTHLVSLNVKENKVYGKGSQCWKKKKLSGKEVAYGPSLER